MDFGTFYAYLKALHIVFIVTWFAGLFYIPRLYIYLIEAQERIAIERDILSNQFLLMIDRLWHIITWPSAILTIAFGISLLIMQPSWIQMGWMHLKLLFVVLLISYHIKSYLMFRQFRLGQYRYSSRFMRLWNEGATLFLFTIVFLVVLKSAIGWAFVLLGLVGLSLLLMLGIKWYKKYHS